MLHKNILTTIVLLFSLKCFSQLVADTINEKEVKEILSYLASDELKGRVDYTREQLLAAEYLGNKFKEYNLSTLSSLTNFYQPFTTRLTTVKDKLKWNSRLLPSTNYMNITSGLFISQKNLKDYKVIDAGDHLSDSILLQHWKDTTDVLIWINKDFVNGTLIEGNIILPESPCSHDILIVATRDQPKEIQITPNKNYLQNVLYNVVGVLPGKSRPNEAIIFSAHYDHVDHNPAGRSGIFNGANDDASGTTAVIELAKYFSIRNDNERTIIFCLFAGEEDGLLGSQAFVPNINPAEIKADINIEMIGMTNRSGKNAFFITGASYSSLYGILRKNLEESSVSILNDNFDRKFLFQRSDNYSFFEKGIAAHSIMCSDDEDPCYHEPCDDADRIDFKNMTAIIKAIAESCSTLINGKDTPVVR